MRWLEHMPTSWKRLRPAFYAALGGVMFAAPAPFVLMTSFSGASEAISGTASVGAALFGALFMGLIAFGVGAMYLLVVGFPTLLLLWLLRLRHPFFPMAIAVLVSLISSRQEDWPLWGLFGVTTGLIAGIYARRCGFDALRRWQ
jgi:hypothetical protein